MDFKKAYGCVCNVVQSNENILFRYEINIVN